MKKHIEEDHIGFQTLDNISDADHLNGWMFSAIKPFLKGDILEVGSGIGNIAAYLMEQPARVTLSDFRESYCKRLEEKFSGQPFLHNVLQMDLVDPAFREGFKALEGTFDTIIALNVIEHIHEDQTAINNLSWLLRKDGHLVILVPAYEFLYNRLDHNLGHYRRYRSSELRALISGAGLDILYSRYFNALGMAGWFVSGALLRNEHIPKDHVWIYNKIIFLSRLIDKIVFNRTGLSTIGVGVKP